jgi:hypothetical protein
MTKDLKGNSNDLIEELSQNLAGGTEVIHEGSSPESRQLPLCDPFGHFVSFRQTTRCNPKDYDMKLCIGILFPHLSFTEQVRLRGTTSGLCSGGASFESLSGQSLSSLVLPIFSRQVAEQYLKLGLIHFLIHLFQFIIQ